MPLMRFIWTSVAGALQKQAADAPLWVTEMDDELQLSSDRGDASLLLAPIPPIGEHVLIALVANGSPHDVTRNGRPLGAGLWPLKHADRIELGGHALWIAVEAAHNEARYEPAVHGNDVFCFLTKARLVEGVDEIAICPGTPSTPCRAIYKLSAWRLAQKSTRPFKCPSCGYSPGKAVWQPVVERPTQTLEQLFDIIAHSTL